MKKKDSCDARRYDGSHRSLLEPTVEGVHPMIAHTVKRSGMWCKPWSWASTVSFVEHDSFKVDTFFLRTIMNNPDRAGRVCSVEGRLAFSSSVGLYIPPTRRNVSFHLSLYMNASRRCQQLTTVIYSLFSYIAPGYLESMLQGVCYIPTVGEFTHTHG